MARKEVISIFLIIIIIFTVIFAINEKLLSAVIFQNNISNFDNGTYQNTVNNGTGIILSGSNESGIYISQIIDAGYNASWNNLTWNGTKPTISFLYSVDGAGDVYESENLGVNWTLKNDNYGRTSDTIHMFSNEFIYIISNVNREVWRSINGSNFTVINKTFADSNIFVGDTNNGNIFVIDGSGDFYISTDNGVSWGKNGDINGVATNNPKGIAINNSGAIFAVDGSGSVFSSIDNGVTWTTVNTSYGGSTGTDDMTSDNISNLYILLNKQIYKSTDNGISWSIINNSFTPYANDGFKITSDSNDYLYIADGLGRIFTSTNGGVSWQEKGDLNGVAGNDPKGITYFTQYTNITFQMTSCNTANCSDSNWQENNLSNINLTGRYFQYKVNLSTQNLNISPLLSSVTIDYTVINTPPTITINSPANQTYATISILFNTTATDTTMSTCLYTLNNGLNNFTMTNLSTSSTQWTATNTTMAQGSHTVRFYCNDTLNDINDSERITFFIDSISPIIDYGSATTPTNNQSAASIFLNVSVTESNEANITFRLFYSNGTLINSSTFINANRSINFSSLSDATYVFNVTVSDIVGNINTTASRFVTVDSVKPLVDYMTGTPTANSNQSFNHVFINVSVTETNENAIAFKFYYSNGTIINTSVFTDNRRTINWTGLTDNTYHFNVTVNDSAGNSNTTLTRAVTVDTIIPNISITTPSNNSVTSSTNFNVNFTVFDSNKASCWYSNDSMTVNVTISNCNNLTTLSWGEGQHNITIHANDSSGNENKKSVTFTIDTIAPVISIIHPSNGSTLGNNASINLNITVSDPHRDSCWYNINNGQNSSFSNCQNTTFNVSGDGNFNLTVFANDTVNNAASSLSQFSITMGAPSITLHYPINQYLNITTILFNYTPYDIDLDSCELWGDFDGTFKVNQTNNSPSNNQTNNFTLNLTDGTYLWNIKCNDTLGSEAFDGNKTFYVDTLLPNLTLSQPQGSKTTRNNLPIDFTTNDLSPISCLYNVYRGNNLEITNTSINCSMNTTFNVSVDADFVLNFYVNDSAGNTKSTSTNFNVVTTTSGGSGGGGGGGGGGGVGGVVGGSGGGGLLVKRIVKIEVSKIGEIIAYPGDKKTLSINVKNIGNVFLNNCKLIFNGNISSWFYFNEVKGIAPGENANFIFDSNIPEQTENNNYNVNIEFKCDEISELQEILMTVNPRSKNIEIKEIKHNDNKLNVSYIFNNSNLLDEEISVEIWIVDDEGNEILRYTDIFPINKNGLTNRDVLIDIPKDIVGIYSVYLAISPELDKFVKQTVVIGKNIGTGGTVLDAQKGKVIGYFIFVLIIFTGIIFIISYRKKDKEKNLKKIK